MGLLITNAQINTFIDEIENAPAKTDISETANKTPEDFKNAATHSKKVNEAKEKMKEQLEKLKANDSSKQLTAIETAELENMKNAIIKNNEDTVKQIDA